MKGLFKKTIVQILTWQAQFLLKRNNPKIIAITGNLGKTSTKDFVYAALRKNLLNEKDVSRAIKDITGIEVDPNAIVMNHIKELGSHTVKIKKGDRVGNCEIVIVG